MSTVWLLRNDVLDNDLEDLGLITIGWDETGDLRGMSKSEILAKLREARPEKSEPSHASSVGSLLRFRDDVRIGDVVVAPRQDGRHLRIGTVTGDYFYDADAEEHRHRRTIRWERTDVVRSELPVASQRSLKSVRTLSLMHSLPDMYRRMAQDHTYIPEPDGSDAVEHRQQKVAALVSKQEQSATFRNPLPSAQSVYAAADAWREALINGTSLFTGQPMNYREVTAALTSEFINSPDESADDFLTKLERQLSSSSDDTIQFAAELFYIYFLPISTGATRSSTKDTNVSTIVNWRESVQSAPAPLAKAMQAGIARVGTSYQTNRNKMYAYLVEVVDALFQLDDAARRSAVENWDDFQAVLATVDDQSVWAMRFLVEHLLFPDRVPDSSNRNDRAKMLKVFGAATGDGSQSGAASEVGDLRFWLAPNLHYGRHSSLALYRPPYRNTWSDLSDEMKRWAEWATFVVGDIAAAVPDGLGQQATDLFTASADELPALLSGLLGENAELTRRANEDAPGLHALLDQLDDLGAGLFIDRVAEWVGVSDLSAMKTKERDNFLEQVSTVLAGAGDYPVRIASTISAVQRLTRRDSPSESATPGEHYLAYLDRMDLLIAAVQQLTGDLPGRREVAWLTDHLLHLKEQEMIERGWNLETRQAYALWISNKPVDPPAEGFGEDGDEEGTDTPHADTGVDEAQTLESGQLTFEDLAAKLYISSDDGLDWLEELTDMVRDKGQVILQGPPGTGKTYIARAVAEHLTTPDRVRTVQFHPGTAYEDFVQGLRPDPDNRAEFRIADGPLVKLADLARQDPEHEYVLIIDEINRANLPAVFGELYFLLEYRGDEVTMTYGAQFSLPPNLRIIGTMNTADRSITAVDAALRRRFFVVDVRPGQTPLDETLPSWLEAHAADLDWLTQLLTTANEKIGDRDRMIGPSHFMTPSLSERSAKRAWEHSVMPTLTELFYAQPERLKELRFDELKAVVTKAGPDADAD